MQIRQVEIGRGLGWVTEAFAAFLKDWGMWIVLFLISSVLMFACSFVPFFGGVATPLLASLLGGGLMHACRVQDCGGELKVDDLFRGFSENTRQLLMIGVVNLLAMAGVGILVAIAVGGAVLSLRPDDFYETLPVSSLIGTLFVALVVLAVAVPVSMAAWFAPALVMLERMEALDAMKLSFQACLRNMLPFLVYGAILLVLFLVAAVPMGLGILVLGPTLIVSIYVSYRDLFTV